MALVTMDVQSVFLNGNTEITVILPDIPWSAKPAEFYGSGKKYPVLWLLHGTFGDHTDWIRKSNIEVYACERDCIVVMMSALNTVYDDWPDFCMGFDNFRFITEELMPLIHNWFPASDKREDNFIAGLSMGGRGTMKISLERPELFGGAASLSSVPMEMDSDIEQLTKLFNTPKEELEEGPMNERRTWNDMHRAGSVEAYVNGRDNTWRHLKERAEDGTIVPKYFFSIGTEDGAYVDGRYDKFREYAKTLGINAVFTEGPGRHEWRVWDRDIEKALDYFGIGKDKKGGNPF
jgi:S-formylglutathione hydrolase FrmB